MGWRMFALLTVLCEGCTYCTCMYVQCIHCPCTMTGTVLRSDVLYRFLGTSGQNVENIFKFSSVNDRLTILENTFLWRHISPTSPDTLSEYSSMNQLSLALNQPIEILIII